MYRSSASHLFSNLFVSSKVLFLIEFFSRGFVGRSLGPCIICLHVHMLQSWVWFILYIISVMAGILSRLMLHNIIICTVLFENLKLLVMGTSEFTMLIMFLLEVILIHVTLFAGSPQLLHQGGYW